MDGSRSLSLGDVAAHSGFCYLRTFRATFRAENGCSPAVFRERYGVAVREFHDSATSPTPVVKRRVRKNGRLPHFLSPL